MKSKRPRGTGSTFRMKESRVVWIKYHRNGKAIRESSHTTKVREAEKLLSRRIGEAAAGNFIEPRDRRILVDDLYTALLDDYRNNDSGEAERNQRRWDSRLKAHFGGVRASNLTTERLNRYVGWAREQGLANGTINRDMAALRRGFNLCLEAGRIQLVPHFPHLKEAAPRSGFVEEAEFQKLAEHASSLWLRALLTTAFRFGFRKSELLNLRVRQFNLMDRTIRLNAGETKSGDGRLIKLTEDVYVLLQALVAGKSGDDHVFTREDGEPVRDFREAWATLCGLAELPELLFHDLRRSAVRNMVRRGVSEQVAMRISGHKTRSIFDRYDIVSESDLADAARKIEEFGQGLGRVSQESNTTSNKTPLSRSLLN